MGDKAAIEKLTIHFDTSELRAALDQIMAALDGDDEVAIRAWGAEVEAAINAPGAGVVISHFGPTTIKVAPSQYLLALVARRPGAVG